MSKHTPAPWRVDWDGEDLWNNHIVCSEGRICFMAHSGPERQDEFDANARLIAAAPDMLAALYEALEYFEAREDINYEGTGPNDAMSHAIEIRAAIAKAEAKR